MLGGINTYTSYSALFKNPIGLTDLNPYSNIIYGAGITALYSKRLNQKLGNEISGYMQSMKNSNDNYKEAPITSEKKGTGNTNDPKIAGPAVPHAGKNQHSANISNTIESQVNQPSKPRNAKVNISSSGIYTYSAKEPAKSIYINSSTKSTNPNNIISDKANDKISYAYADTKEQPEADNEIKVRSEKTQINTDNKMAATTEDHSKIQLEKNNRHYVEQYYENTKYSYGNTGQKIYLSRNKQQGLLFDTIA
ncbi:MAG: hypothetical protein ACM3TR_05375 [Caulobacteraceae bacterium]